MAKKKKKTITEAVPKVYAKALAEIAQDIASAREYRKMPKRTAEEFLSERNEVGKQIV